MEISELFQNINNFFLSIDIKEYLKLILCYGLAILFFIFILSLHPVTRGFLVLMWNVLYLICTVLNNIVLGLIWLVHKMIDLCYIVVNKIRMIFYKRRVKKEFARRDREAEEYRKAASESYSEGYDESANNDQKYKNYSKSNKSLEDTYAAILGLNENRNPNDIKKAYREIMKKYHADKVQTMGKEFQDLAHEKSKEINEAYGFFKKRYGF